MVDSLDSDLYGNSYGRYINHSVSPNVVVKVKMVAGIPTILLCATSVPALSIDYGDRRPSVPDWMRSTGRTRAPVPADETACAALSIDYSDRRPSVPDWMRSTGRTRTPVPAEEPACAALSIDYSDRRPSVPDWMRSTGRTRTPVPADESACADLAFASTVEGSIHTIPLTSTAPGAELVKITNAKQRTSGTKTVDSKGPPPRQSVLVLVLIWPQSPLNCDITSMHKTNSFVKTSLKSDETFWWCVNTYTVVSMCLVT